MAEKDYENIDVNDKRYPHAWKYVKKKFHMDDSGHYHPIDPRFLARRNVADVSKKPIDDETVPSIYIFNIEETKKPLLVTRSGFEARDKNSWFPTKTEAKAAKSKLLDEKIVAASKRKKSLEAVLDKTDANE